MDERPNKTAIWNWLNARCEVDPELDRVRHGTPTDMQVSKTYYRMSDEVTVAFRGYPIKYTDAIVREYCDRHRTVFPTMPRFEDLD